MIPKLQSIINFSITDSGQGYYLLQSNQSYQLSGQLFSNNFDLNNIVVKAVFNIPVIGPTTFTHKIKLYVVDNDNLPHYVDSASVSNGVASFDFTPYAFSNKERITSFYIANESTNTSIKFDATANAASLTIDYIEYKETFLLTPHISDSLNKKISYSYCNLNNRLLLNYSFFKDVLSIDINLVYSNDLESYPNSILPLGWKISCLDYFLINRNQQNEITSLSLVDKDNFKHEFSPLLLNNNETIYYSNNGSSLLLREIVVNNVSYLKLFNNINNAYKLFDLNGRLVAVYDEYNRQTLSVQYGTNYIDITDSNDNVVRFAYDSNQSKITITLNNTLFYELNINNNLLSSISYSVYSDSFNYTNNRLDDVTCIDGNNVVFTYISNNITNIEKKHGQTLIDSSTFSANYLETIITNRHGVSVFYRYNDNLEFISSGEVPIDEEDEKLILTVSNDLLIEDASISLTNPVGVGYLTSSSNSPSKKLNASTNSLESEEFVTSSDSFSITAGHKYIIIAKLEKETDIPISDTRKAYIKVKFGSTYTDTLYFDPYKKTQIKAFLITAPSSTFPKIYAYAKGFKNFSGVTFSCIELVKFKGNATTYYARKEASDPQSINGFSSPVTIVDNTTLWFKFITSQFSYNGQSFTYSYDDLIANYIGAYRQDNLYWRNDCHELVQDSNGYYMKGTLCNSTSNCVFAKRTISKVYLDENDNERKIYQFEYLERTTNGFKKVITNVVGSDKYKIVEEYDNQLHLLSKTEDDNYYEEYEYDLNGNEISLTSGNSVDNQIIKQESTYDLLNREIGCSDGLFTQSTSYINDTYLIYSSSYINNNQPVNTLIYSYSTNYLYVTNIAQGTSNIHRSDNSDLRIKYLESDDTKLSFTYDAYGLTLEPTVYTELNKHPFPSISRSLNATTDYFILGKIRYTYNRYGKLQYFGTGSPSIGYTDNTTFIYCIEKPNNLSDIDDQDSDELRLNSKLYKIIDGNSSLNTTFDYDEDNNLNGKSVDGTNFSYDLNYNYDVLNRINKKILRYRNSSGSHLQNTLTLDIDYHNNLSNDITKLSYIIFNGSLTQTVGKQQQIEYDDFHRSKSITQMLGINSMPVEKYYLLAEYNYLSLNNSRTSNYVSKVDYIFKTVDINHNNENAIYLDLYSEYITYNSTGDIASIRRGTSTTPDNTTGVSYLYDSCNRLIEEINLDYGFDIEYNYDAKGNITSVIKTNLNNNSSDTETYAYSSTYKDLLICHNGNCITYDDDCNPLTYGSNISYSWTRNHLLETITIDNNTTSFEYDYRGIRTSKTNSTGVKHSYFLDDKLIVGERITSGTSFTNNIYLYGKSGPITIVVDGVDYNLQTNMLGDIVAILDGNNNILAKYVYDAFGNHKIFDGNGLDITENNSSHIGHINPFRYRGYYYDEETCLYCCESRYYNPKIRRWLTPDQLWYIDINKIDGINPFIYCLNNPIKYTDPSGKFLILGFVLSLASVGIAVAAGAIGTGLALLSLGMSIATGVAGLYLLYETIALPANIYLGCVLYSCYKENGDVTFINGNVRFKNTYRIRGFGKIFGFVVRMFFDNDFQRSVSFRRWILSYCLEWEIHNLIYYTLNALKTLSFNSSAFDSDIDRAATVDMEDDVFWLFNMID